MFWTASSGVGDRPAHQFKQSADWKTITWREVGDVVREGRAALALGRDKGDAVALLSTSRPNGSRPILRSQRRLRNGPGLPPYPPDLIAYVVKRFRAKTIIVEDPGQLSKVLGPADKMPGLEQIGFITGNDAPQPPRWS